MRKIITAVLVLFALATLGMTIKDFFESSQPLSASGVEKDNHIVVMYFLIGNKRCDMCKKMEVWTRQAVGERFPQQAKAGEIKFSIINTDLDGNRHYRKDFELPFKTVVVARYENGQPIKWVRLDELWTPAREDDRETFFDIIIAAVDQVSEKGAEDE